MGDRINFVFKTQEFAVGEPESYLTLYSHWGATDAKETLAYALRSAEPRWNDSTYGVRITISHIIGPDWDKETNYGLYIGNGDYWDEVLEIDWVNKTVDGHSFDEFCTYHGAPKLVKV
jgi:hypothetical protein